MYTRPFYQDEAKITVPENYDGNAFSEKEEVKADTEVLNNIGDTAEPLRAPWDEPKIQKNEPTEPVFKRTKEPEGIFSSLLKKSPLTSLFGGELLKGFALGSEEILIIAVALFLLFSKGGDKECAVMLLLLLLVK